MDLKCYSGIYKNVEFSMFFNYFINEFPPFFPFFFSIFTSPHFLLHFFELMKVLIIIAHCDPTKKATAYRFAKAAEEALLAAGNEVKVTDIVHEGFDRVATEHDFLKVDNGGLENFSYIPNQREDNLIEPIIKQQKLLLWCTHVLIIGPMYYYRYPACLYAYIERVFTNGFAFGEKDGKQCVMKDGLLKGRKLSCVITAADKAYHFSPTGNATLESFLYTTTFAFRFVGFEATRSMGYFGANDPEVVAKEPEYLEKFKKAIVKIDSWPLLPEVDKVTKPGEKNEAVQVGELEPLTPEMVLNM